MQFMEKPFCLLKNLLPTSKIFYTITAFDGRLRGDRDEDQGMRRTIQHQDGAQGGHGHRRSRPRQADGES